MIHPYYRATSSTPDTTKIPEDQEPKAYFTPHSQRDINRQLEPIKLQLGALNKGFSIVRRKAGQALEYKNDEILQLKRKVKHLEAEVKAKRPQRKV